MSSGSARGIRRQREPSGARSLQRGGSQRAGASRPPSPCAGESGRADRKRDALGRGGSRRSPARRSRKAEALRRGGSPRDGKHLGENSAPMTRTPARAIRIARDPRPHRRHRPPGRRSRRPVDVEADVLRNRPAPRVVERRDPVVLVTTASWRQTNSRLSSRRAARRWNQPYSASVWSPETSRRPSHSLRVTHQSETPLPESKTTSTRLSPGSNDFDEDADRVRACRRAARRPGGRTRTRSGLTARLGRGSRRRVRTRVVGRPRSRGGAAPGRGG